MGLLERIERFVYEGPLGHQRVARCVTVRNDMGSTDVIVTAHAQYYLRGRSRDCYVSQGYAAGCDKMDDRTLAEFVFDNSERQLLKLSYAVEEELNAGNKYRKDFRLARQRDRLALLREMVDAGWIGATDYPHIAELLSGSAPIPEPYPLVGTPEQQEIAAQAILRHALTGEP